MSVDKQTVSAWGLPPSLAKRWSFATDTLTHFGPRVSFAVLCFCPSRTSPTQAPSLSLLHVTRGSLTFEWCMPWHEFRLRCAPMPASPPRPRPSPPRAASPSSAARGGAHAIARLPDGSPPALGGLAEEIARRRVRTRGAAHVVVAVLPPPPALDRRMRALVERIRQACAQLSAALDLGEDNFVVRGEDSIFAAGVVWGGRRAAPPQASSAPEATSSATMPSCSRGRAHQERFLYPIQGGSTGGGIKSGRALKASLSLPKLSTHLPNGRKGVCARVPQARADGCQTRVDSVLSSPPGRKKPFSWLEGMDDDTRHVVEEVIREVIRSRSVIGGQV